MNNLKTENYKSERESSTSREYPLVDGLTDRSVPWPKNLGGFVVGQKELEDFIGNQTLRQAQATAKRLVVIAEAAHYIAKGEEFEMNWRLIRFVANEDRSEGNQRLMGAMIRAIDQGEEGIKAATLTALHVMDFGFNYMTSYGDDFIYDEGLERMRQAAGRID